MQTRKYPMIQHAACVFFSHCTYTITSYEGFDGRYEGIIKCVRAIENAENNFLPIMDNVFASKMYKSLDLDFHLLVQGALGHTC